jgi:hypothetical protein
MKFVSIGMMMMAFVPPIGMVSGLLPMLGGVVKIVKTIIPTSDSDEIVKVIEKTQKDEGYYIIKTISTLLPRFDGVGHKILHANDEFIALIINQESIPHDVKQKIILGVIRMSMMGDDLGSNILHLYYDIVKNCF